MIRAQVIMVKVYFPNQSCVTQVVGHHDARVKRGKIKSSNGLLIETWLGVKNIGTLKAYFTSITLNSLSGHNEISFPCLAEELADNFNLLASCKKEINWDSSHTSHFTVIIETAKFLHQP